MFHGRDRMRACPPLPPLPPAIHDGVHSVDLQGQRAGQGAFPRPLGRVATPEILRPVRRLQGVLQGQVVTAFVLINRALKYRIVVLLYLGLVWFSSQLVCFSEHCVLLISYPIILLS